jgi:hypothetical protein
MTASTGPSSFAAAKARQPSVGSRAACAGLLLLMSACTTLPQSPGTGQVTLPMLSGWFEGEEVFYVTTDVSHADVAEAKGANFSPRLAAALPAGKLEPGRPSSVDKVHAVTNFKQASVFASAPFPMGAASRDTAYSPLWQMVKVTWAAGRTPQALTSEEAVLAAADRGDVALEPARVVLNAPSCSAPGRAACPGWCCRGRQIRAAASGRCEARSLTCRPPGWWSCCRTRRRRHRGRSTCHR